MTPVTHVAVKVQLMPAAEKTINLFSREGNLCDLYDYKTHLLIYSCL